MVAYPIGRQLQEYDVQEHTGEWSKDTEAMDAALPEPIRQSLAHTMAELDTWAGMEKYMDAIHDYASEASHEGEFPRSWEHFKDDIARYIVFGSHGNSDMSKKTW